MITPKGIFDKADKQFLKIVTSVMKAQEIFPLQLRFNRHLPTTGFSELSAVLLPIHNCSKTVKGKGYAVEWKEKTISGSKQKIPNKIYFDTLEDFLFYTKRQGDYAKIQQSYNLLQIAFPELIDWCKDNPDFLLHNFATAADLIKVCQYFWLNPPPHNLYLRELPIEVHSKFIEDNVAPIKQILDVLLPPDWVNLNDNNFLDRYYIKRPNIYAQLRILDNNLKSEVGFDELALTLDDSALLGWKPEKVFIIENKACFFSFPRIRNAVAIFGEGFKSRMTKHINWLNDTELYCWFDLDAAGFEMLNIVRSYYPHAKSVFMDQITYDSFNNFSVTSSYRKIALPHLTDDEQNLYKFLQENNKRLEQERITNTYIINTLDRKFDMDTL